MTSPTTHLPHRRATREQPPIPPTPTFASPSPSRPRSLSSAAAAAQAAAAAAAATVQHGAFYRFVPVADPAALADSLRAQAFELRLLGSIVVATEGVNGAVAGTAAALDRFEAMLARDRRLAGLRLQRSACRTPPFGRLKVGCRAELVTLGRPWAALTGAVTSGVTDAVAGAPRAALTAVSPGDWRQLLDEPDVVLLDNRNGFEFRLGHFRGAIHPQVQHFHAFPEYCERQAEAWKTAGKRVAMYCTGGIRCEKTASWMQSLGLEVYQLQGGILHYFDQLPDPGRDWQGECFVFDNRIAIDARLQETDTTAETVYAGEPDGDWRLARARRLDAIG